MSIHKRVNKRKSVWIVRYRDLLPRERTFERKADAQRFERYVRRQHDHQNVLTSSGGGGAIDDQPARRSTVVADGRKQRTGSEHDQWL